MPVPYNSVLQLKYTGHKKLEILHEMKDVRVGLKLHEWNYHQWECVMHTINSAYTKTIYSAITGQNKLALQ